MCFHRQTDSGLLLLRALGGRLGARFGLADQVPVGGGAQEAGVAVFGHEHVDSVLRLVEAGERRRPHVGSGEVTSFMVDVDLDTR